MTLRSDSDSGRIAERVTNINMDFEGRLDCYELQTKGSWSSTAVLLVVGTLTRLVIAVRKRRDELPPPAGNRREAAVLHTRIERDWYQPLANDKERGSRSLVP